MSELNHRFQKGRMNKDLDERLVPNGEYRDALNVEVSSSEGSNIGALQTIMGNIGLSKDIIDPSGLLDGYCVASIADEKNDRLYWLIAGNGRDIIAEYDYATGDVNPVVVDIYTSGTPANGRSGRVLNFDRFYLITGINVVDGMLFWTDNNTEPKRVHVERAKQGSVDFSTHTRFYVRNTTPTTQTIQYIDSGPIKQEHITVIKKSPPTAPTLEMLATNRGDINGAGGDRAKIETTITIGAHPNQLDCDLFIDPTTGYYRMDEFTLFTDGDSALGDFGADWQAGDHIIFTHEDDKRNVVQFRALIERSLPNQFAWRVRIISGDEGLICNDASEFNIILEQGPSIFEFKFPRFGYRYKYEDGEYSTFSPFTEVAFVPGRFDYLPKEAYNLGMVNNLRSLAVKDFVHGRLIPDDVISIDILYKESNSPNIYSVKTIKRYDKLLGTSWNQVTADHTTSSVPIPSLGNLGNRLIDMQTTGYCKISSEIIHAVLPSNQALRPWDNVPRKALAQEVVGNRLVYANYLQNYDLTNSDAYRSHHRGGVGTLQTSNSIDIALKLGLTSRTVGEIYAEQINPLYADFHGGETGYYPAKSIKTLRTYQLGVIYIDEFGRETPVFTGGNTFSSLRVEKGTANLESKLQAQILSTPPEWAKSFKFLIKETSNEYYNLALDRWYNAKDGNIWLSFPSSERNKVDIETFLTLKKEHDSDTFVSAEAKYKILALENEAPSFIKTERIPLGEFTDDKGYTIDIASVATSVPLLGYNNGTFPSPNNTSFFLDQTFVQNLGWATHVKDADKTYPGNIAATPPTGLGEGPGEEGTFYLKDPSDFELRFKVPGGTPSYSLYYKIKSIEWAPPATAQNNVGWYKITVTKPFGTDTSILSSDNTWGNRLDGIEVELYSTEEKNKPEFEGRFFAKIKKDYTLIQTIIVPSATLSSANYSVINSMPVQYIDPISDHDNDYDVSGNWDWFSLTSVPYPGISLSSLQPNNSNIAPIGSSGARGQAYWAKAGTSGTNTPSGGTAAHSSGWFIDKIEGFRRFKWTKEFSNIQNSYVATAGAKATWLLEFGIGELFDFGAGVGSSQMQVIGTNSDDPASANQYLGIGSNKTPGTTLRDKKNIVPSVGIEPTDGIIHLSYAGIGVNESVTSPGPGAVPNWDMSSSVNDEAFIIELTTPGTLWRWKEDPDQVVYRTMGNSGAGYSGAEWSANTKDGYDFNPGVGLYNYVAFKDYPIEHAWTHKYEGNIYGGCPSQAQHGHTMLASQFKNADIHQCYYGPGWAIKADELYDFHNAPHAYWNDSGSAPIATPGLNWTPSASGWPTATTATNEYPMINDSWHKKDNRRRRFMFRATPLDNPGDPLGSTGPSQYLPTNDPFAEPHFDEDGDVLETIVANPSTLNPLPSTPAPGIRPDGMYTGHELPAAAVSIWPNAIPPKRMANSAATADFSPPAGSVTWEIVTEYELEMERYQSADPAVFETEPKEDIGLDIYHEVGQIYPVKLDENNIEQFIGPLSPIISNNPKAACYNPPSAAYVGMTTGAFTDFEEDIRVEAVVGNSVILSDVEGNPLFGSDGYIFDSISGGSVNTTLSIGPERHDILSFTRSDGSVTKATVLNTPTTFNRYDCVNGTCTPVEGGVYSSVQECIDDSAVAGCFRSGSQYELDPHIHNHEIILPWFNCYSFGNGVESDRIRDDFNQVVIDDGPIVSTVLEEPYMEETRASGLIYSGIYNSTSGVNNLNQFIQAEKITKDLNPIYGSIQKLHTRDTNLLALCEDKVFKILANKDALYNADGNPQLIATSNVLGQTVPFMGEFGISKNPESFAADAYRTYFTDKTRGTVLRLSQDGITPISAHGMKDYFADNLDKATRMIGSVDDKKQSYNLTVDFQKFVPQPPAVASHILASTEYPCYWDLPMAPPGVPVVGSVQPPGCRDYGALLFPTTIRINKSTPVAIGDIVVGGGLPPGTIVTDVPVGLNDGHPSAAGVPLSHQHNDNTGIYRDIQVDSIPTSTATAVVLESVDLGPYGGNLYADLYGHPIDVSIYTPPTYVPILPFTASFSEVSKGWESFKSWHQENGVSLNNRYYTFKDGQLWEHHQNELRNNFYGVQSIKGSTVRVLFNEVPGTVKSFQTISYEGTKSKITEDTGHVNSDGDIVGDGEYWDNIARSGWYVDELYTDLQEGDIHEFKDKEGKWFSQIKGVTTKWLDDGEAGNIDTQEFSYQGIADSLEPVIPDGGGGFTSWDCKDDNGNGLFRCQEEVGTGGNYVTKQLCLDDTCMDCPCKNINPHLYSCNISGYCQADPTCTGPNCWGTESECIDNSICLSMPHYCDGSYCMPDPDCTRANSGGEPCYEGTSPTSTTSGESGEDECLRLSTCTWSNPHSCNPTTSLCEPDSAGIYVNYQDCVDNTSCFATDDPHLCNGSICVGNSGCDPVTNPFCYPNMPACHAAGCGIPNPWTCDAITGDCISVLSCTGPNCYYDEIDCQTNSPCQPPVAYLYDCVNGNCQINTTGGGMTLSDCSNFGYNGGPCSVLNPCNIPPTANHSTIDPQVNQNGVCQDNGEIDIAVVCSANLSTQWSVTIYDVGMNALYTSSMQNGDGNIVITVADVALGDGSYSYIVTDGQGCSVPGYFTMTCIGTYYPDTYNCNSGTGNCDTITYPAIGAYTSISTCQLTCGVSGQSWDCDGMGSCYDPGGGNGNYTNWTACHLACSAITPSWDCNGSSCIDPGTGLGSYSDFAVCQNACTGGSNPSWDCDAATNQCYDPGTGNGAFNLLSACQSACSAAAVSFYCIASGCYDLGDGLGPHPSLSACQNVCTNSPAASWNCVSGSCIDPGTGNGQYGILNNCLSACVGTGSTPSWDCISGSCIDPGDGSGYYFSNSACLLNCGGGTSDSWNCPGGGGPCYDPGTGNGTYTSETFCNSVCFAPTYNCSGSPLYNCSDPLDGSGTWNSLSTCQANCSGGTGPCTPPDPQPSITLSTTDPQPSSCNNGGADIELTNFNGGTASSWTVKWFSVSPNGTVSYLWQDYDALGAAIYWNAGDTSSDPGLGSATTASTPMWGSGTETYIARVILDTGCSWDYPFSLTCVTSPCPLNFSSITWNPTSNIIPCVAAPCDPATCVTSGGNIDVQLFNLSINGPVDIHLYDAAQFNIATGPTGSPVLCGGVPCVELGVNVGNTISFTDVIPVEHGTNCPGVNCANDDFVVYIFDPVTGCWDVFEVVIPCGGSSSLGGCTDPVACNYDPLATFDDGSCCYVAGCVCTPIYGCTDSTAFNYDPAATIDDGSCCLIAGCTDPLALNYDALACFDDGSCVYCVFGCDDCTATGGNNLATCATNCPDNSCCGGPHYDPCSVPGCTGIHACNYNPLATFDDGSCCYVNGCTDPIANNYDPNAGCGVQYPSGTGCDDGSCTYCVYGCIDPTANNYNPLATCDDGSCCCDPANNACTSYPPCPSVCFPCAGVPGSMPGCCDLIAINYNSTATCDDGSCVYCVYGCTDPLATNYYAGASCDDGSCTYGPPPSGGCTHATATAYGYPDVNGNDSNGGPCVNVASCPPGGYPVGTGCCANGFMAANYDPSATIDDGSCCTNVVGGQWSAFSTWLPDCNTCGCASPTTATPDACFESRLIALGYDTGTPDGSVPTSGITGVQGLNLGVANNPGNCVITDLTGIQCFTSVWYNMFIPNNDIPNLDLSCNTALENFNAQSAGLINTNFDGAIALKNLQLNNNQLLATLDVSNNTALLTLNVHSCSTLTNINLGSSIDLATLWLDYGGYMPQLASLTIQVGTGLRITQAQALWPGLVTAGTTFVL